MSTYFLIMSSRAGRVIRLVIGAILVVGGILGDRHGSLMWLLIVPGLAGVLAALLDLSLLAIFFGFPLIGGDLRSRIQANRKRETGLGRLTFVGDSLQHTADLNRRK